MPHYAYIDESGTMDDQEVMIVAMVVLEGRNSAATILSSALQAVFPRLQQKKEKTQRTPDLHYARLSNHHKVAAGVVLGQSKISCYASSYWHDGNRKNHQARFSIYTELVKTCIKSAFEHYDELEILIAKQGGASEYKKSFLAELRVVPEEYSKKYSFKKAKFELSNVRSGIQIADFYAGATRDFLLSYKDVNLTKAYELVQNQILCIEAVEYSVTKSKK